MSKNQGIIKDFRVMNEKFIIPMSKEVIYFLPYSNKKLENEFVVRLLLQFEEPADELTSEQKIEYHTKNNNKALSEILKTLTNVNYSEISNVSSEAWIIFNEYDEKFLDILSKSKYVSGIIIYTIDGESNLELIPNEFDDNQDNDPSDPSGKAIISIDTIYSQLHGAQIPDSKINLLSKEIIDSIKVDKSQYDGKSASLTIDLNKYKSEDEVAQLFAYIYLNKENSSYLLKHLVKIVCQEIETKKYGYQNISRINFDINSSKNGFDPIRRDLQFTAYNTFFLGDDPSIVEIEKYLGSSVRFKVCADVELSFKNSILYYKDYFDGICNQIYILRQISSFDPSDLEISKIGKSSTNSTTLGVQFRQFNTQEKMNLLFAYLAREPINKQYWIEQITNKILASLEEQKIGKISDFSFIAFNFNEQLKERVKVASIGGIYQTINTKELDIDNPDSIQMVENCLDPNRAKFNSYLDVYRGITENISWNRSTYLAYNNVNSLLLKYTKEELDLLVLPTFDPWLKFEKIFDKLDLGEYKFGNNQSHVIFNFNLIKEPSQFRQLFALMSVDPYKRGKKWIDTIVHYAKKAIILLKKNFEDISYISFDIHDNTIDPYIPGIGGFASTAPIYGEQDPKDIMDKNNKFKNPNSILKALLYNLEANGRELQIQQANNGFPILFQVSSPFAQQFSTVGLNEYFSKSANNQLGFNDKYDNSVGVLEAARGLIDYNEQQIFSNQKKINHPSGIITQHANLVGLISCSSFGVDRYSTIVSSGFGSSNIIPLTSAWNLNTSIDWMVNNGIKILNCSWGAVKEANDPVFWTYSEIAFKLDYIARKFGLTIIKSAGNNHNQKNPPFFGDSNLALNIINVGSTNPNGTVLSIFSDYEKNPKFLFTKEAPKPLVVAPGESYYNIRTKTYHNGTSYSAPLVTGTVSILMKEFPQIRENPVAVMSVLAASSLDIYSTEINNNGLRYATGAGLLDYPMARIASKNVEVKLVENNLAPGTQLFESDCIILREGEQLIASCSSLFNGAYVDTRESQYLWPTRGGLSSFPIIGAIYLAIAHSKNRQIMNDFKSHFEEYFTKLKLDKTIDLVNLDKSLLPYNLKIELERFDLRTGKWNPANWTVEPTSNTSNIKKYTYMHLGESAGFKYIVKVNKTATKLSFDKTKNYVSATHVVRKV